MEICVASLQWRHISFIASQITGISTVSQMLAQVDIKVPHRWSFVRKKHRWQVDFLHRGPVMRKAFPCNYVNLVLARRDRDDESEIWWSLPYIFIPSTILDTPIASFQGTDTSDLKKTPLGVLAETDLSRVNTLRPRQCGCHFPNEIFPCIFLNENAWLLIKISPKFVPKGSN